MSTYDWLVHNVDVARITSFQPVITGTVPVGEDRICGRTLSAATDSVTTGVSVCSKLVFLRTLQLNSVAHERWRPSNMNFPFPAGQSTPFKLTFKTDADEVTAAAGTAAAAVANTNELEVAVGPKFCHSWKIRLIMCVRRIFFV